MKKRNIKIVYGYQTEGGMTYSDLDCLINTMRFDQIYEVYSDLSFTQFMYKMAHKEDFRKKFIDSLVVEVVLRDTTGTFTEKTEESQGVFKKEGI